MENDSIKEGYLGCNEGDEDSYDAIVVGSGYGGSVAACRMSMAGIKVCLLEKGRKWEGQDFPTDSFKLLSTVRFENKSLGFGLGPKDALFQIHKEHDSVAVTVCGLGGGSLVNAGVMLPTPVRAKRNPKWPKEWESDWKACEASASSMLNIQSVPVKFPNARTMEKLVGDEFKETSSLKLSINFDVEEQGVHLKRSKESGSCIACGNCLSGCPYNAKNSTDKNYLFTAVEAGCSIKTDCEVKYVVKNPNYTNIHGKPARRWLVYLNDTDYLQSDFVILSGGVFGTADLLFRSQTRGLELSSRLGEGFSCNGNNTAYLAGCTTPLGAFGLHKEQFSKIPFQERPGPAISSSYTSSLGFTIQSGVLPTAYPYLMFKGVLTYGWPTGFWFLHGLIDKLKHTFGLKSTEGMALTVTGYDESDGKITFDKSRDKINFSPPNNPLLPRKIISFQKLTKKLGGILFMSRFRSTSVHLLGGCNASSDHFLGVCNSNGQVFDTKSPSSVHSGLYVCDASLIPCSIGVNPCLTIATASEHVSRHLVQDIIKTYVGNEGKDFVDVNDDKNRGSIHSWRLEGKERCDVRFKEVMRGHIDGMPCVAHLKLKMNVKTTKDFDQGNLVFGKSHSLLRGIVGGYVDFNAVEKDRLYVVDGEVDLCEVDIKTPYTQFMHYRLLLAASSGSRYILEGKKVMNPFLLGLYGWKESTTLQVTFKKLEKNSPSEEVVDLKGVLHVSTIALVRSLISMEGNNKMKFVWLLLQSIFRTYVIQKPRGNFMDSPQVEPVERPYPSSTLHEIRTEDGFVIGCRQWKIKKDDSWNFRREKNPYPVLLINGYSTDSYWLPTEENDLVRTLLDKGHETWLLQPRLHPLNTSNSFTIEDIGKFDIPAAIDKILKLNEKSMKIHVVAHCVGGLAIHMAIMGGHVSAARIASLSCTNSSMFFKLTPYSTFKMWLPLLPVNIQNNYLSSPV
ncbi:hypothetical protein L2E82_20542 [Cichorium intybus]|uniref:Uncharacterized protein n=1 Tax=Cichorium intybus TaxID=13427 RepID=A0ACB9DUM3_CICIN|nr:hypothetical protein L2E82_20542 [Cichorium intybus]